MKSVAYSSWQKLSCGCAPADIVLCMDEALTADNSGFIEGQLTYMSCSNDSCGRTIYNYNFTYDEALLLDPDTNLNECDITGVFCDSCLTKYVIWKSSSPFVSYPTDPYIFVMPEGPPPFSPGEPFSLDVVSIVGNTVTLAWHVITVAP